MTSLNYFGWLAGGVALGGAALEAGLGAAAGAVAVVAGALVVVAGGVVTTGASADGFGGVGTVEGGVEGSDAPGVADMSFRRSFWNSDCGRWK